MEGEQQNQVFIGSHTQDKEAHGVFHYDPNKQVASTVLSCINPTYITCSKDNVYIASEVEKGEIITLTHKFEILSRVSTLGKEPCHLCLNKDASFLTVCNYGSGSVAIFILEDGKPTKIRCFMTHEGSSTHPIRQTGPHPHCSLFTPQGDAMFVTDLGTDVLYYYSITEEAIQAEKEKSIKMPGSGPRTICHGPSNEKRVFVSCELDNTVRMLTYENGPLELMVAYRVSNNPQNFPSEVSYFKEMLYIALRGDNMIIEFEDQKDKLQQKIAFRTGDWPRHFTITEYGVMYIACERENKVQRYLFKEGKILQIGELNIPLPMVVAVSPVIVITKGQQRQI